MQNSSAVLEKFVHAGVMKAELSELFSKRFLTNCYAGFDLRLNDGPVRLVIKVRDPMEAIGDNRYKLRQLQNMVAQRLAVPTNHVEIIFEKIAENRLEPAVHCEKLRQAFLKNEPYKKIINGIIKDVNSAGGQGVMVKVAGKLKGLRAKSTKYFSGLLIHSGQPGKDYIKTATTEAKCRQGVIGVSVSVMLPHDPEGLRGPSAIMPDKIMVLEPKVYN